MEHLKLLFTKDGFQYQFLQNKTVAGEGFFMEENSEQSLLEKIDEILVAKKLDQISVISAINHFTVMPAGFSHHELGFNLIALNAPVNEESEELMLAINKKFGIQFYYSFSKAIYQKIKGQRGKINFNFSGEQFLHKITVKNQKEIHINLYRSQCEFFALDKKKVILYNNLDVNSEVDFLYFIMFTIKKIGFGITDTQFFVYGETTENETFISELRKFVKKIKIVYDNIPKRNFVMQG